MNSMSTRLRIKEKLEDFRNNGDSTHLAEAAHELLLQGKFRFAKSLATKALALSEGKCGPALLVLANIFAARGELRRAIKPLLQLAKCGQHLQAYKSLAKICVWEGKSSRATLLLTLAVKRHSDNLQYLLLLGEHHREHREYILAWRAFQQCLRRDEHCKEALEGALSCAESLKVPELALEIANRLCELEPAKSIYQHKKALLYWEVDQPDRCCEAYNKAWRLEQTNLGYFLNASIPVYRIPENGITAHVSACKVRLVSSSILESLAAGESWSFDENTRLLPLVFYCAYSPINVRLVYEPYYYMLKVASTSWVDSCIKRSETQFSESTIRSHMPPNLGGAGSCQEARESTKKIRLGLLSASFHAHSTATALGTLIRNIDRNCFELVLVHRQSPIVDTVQMRLNALADTVVYLDWSLEFNYYLLKSQELDILYFADLGFDPQDFLIPELRTASIQMTGWGVPHTSGLRSIDYYLSSSWLESPDHQVEYVEKLVLLEGLPACISSEDISYIHHDRDYFLLPNDRLIIACVQTLWKIHPDFDLVVERIALQLPHALFVFVDCGAITANELFQRRLARRAPRASEQTVFLSRCATEDFLSLCDCVDILLDTPYFGSGITAYLSMLVGTPIVTMAGSRLRDGTVEGIYRFLGINHAPIASSLNDYVDLVLELAGSPERRLETKRHTIRMAHLLYNNLTYVHSFERFCKNLCGII